MSKKILVIDDELDVITYLQMALEDNGYIVFVASNAAAGWAAAINELPDVICLDILMPGKTGISLLNEFRNEPTLNNTRVVIISGMITAQNKDYANLINEPGKNLVKPDAFVEKPIILDSFLETIQRLTQ